jgi:glycosyltransferase involved in cell wall biosynthesis
MSPHNKICRLSVLIPVYNEEKTFRTMLEGIQRIRPSNLRKEYIVVDDGSTDGTLEAVRNTPCPGLRVFRHERRLGRGAAIRTAIRHARGDFIVFQDADLEYDPQAHVSVMEPLLDGRADAVFGSRFLRKGNTFLAWSYVGNKSSAWP